VVRQTGLLTGGDPESQGAAILANPLCLPKTGRLAQAARGMVDTDAADQAVQLGEEGKSFVDLGQLHGAPGTSRATSPGV